MEREGISEKIHDFEEKGDVEGIMKLIEAGEDNNTKIAVEALRRLADPRSVDLLIRLIGLSDYYSRYGGSLKKGSGAYQQDLLDALASFGSAAVPKLLEDFKTNHGTRGLVAQVLGKIGDPQAVQVLTDYLNGNMGTVYHSYEAKKALSEITGNPC